MPAPPLCWIAKTALVFLDPELGARAREIKVLFWYIEHRAVRIMKP